MYGCEWGTAVDTEVTGVVDGRGTDGGKVRETSSRPGGLLAVLGGLRLFQLVPW